MGQDESASLDWQIQGVEQTLSESVLVKFSYLLLQIQVYIFALKIVTKKCYTGFDRKPKYFWDPNNLFKKITM